MSRRMHRTSRTNENFTEDGLETITGQSPSDWGVYVLKELIDNSLEADEEVSVSVEIETGGHQHVREIGVFDDGPGMDEETIHEIFGDIDYFVGSKRHYALPTRGNQGNALMSILGIQHVVNGDTPLEVHSRGEKYHIEAMEDHLGEYEVRVDNAGTSDIDGFGVRVRFGGGSGRRRGANEVLNTVKKFVLLNPQADFERVINGRKMTYPATRPYSGEPPTDKELVNWFSLNGFIERYQADRAADPDMDVEGFIAQFAGLKTKAEDMAQCVPGDVTDENDLKRLYKRAYDYSPERSPGGLDRTIGSIGPDLKSRLLSYVGDGPQEIVDQIDRDGFDDVHDICYYYDRGGKYREGDKVIPFWFEMALVPTAIKGKDENPRTDFVLGINQSVLYDGGDVKLDREKSEGEYRLSTSFQDNHEFAVVANIYCPNVGFRDKGKQSFNSEPFKEVISKVVGKAKRKVNRELRPRLNELRDEEPDPSLSGKAPNGFIKDFIWENFWDVYNEATDDGTYSIEMRQLYYKFRPPFLDEAEKRGYQYSTKATVDDPKPLELNFGTFSSNISDFEEQELGERLIERDERGFFVEPHTNRRINLGTTAVRQYDPSNVEYGDILFVEKTGFMDNLHREFELTKKYDIGLINSKGWNTIAGRKLVEKIQQENPDATLFVLSDFDIAGVGIGDDVASPDELSDLDELETEKLGLTYEDVQEYGLPSETASYKKSDLSQLETMHDDGIVDDESYEYLADGNRVEINAFSPVELKEYLETKFEEHGITKQHPDPSAIDKPDLPDPDETHTEAIEQAFGRWVMEQIPDGMVETVEESVTVDDALSGQLNELETDAESLTEVIHEELRGNPPKHWSDINEKLVEEREDEAEEASEEYKETVAEHTTEYLNENHSVDFQ